MMKPKTIVLRVGGIKSLNSAFLKPLSRNRRSEMGSASILAIQPMNMPQKSEARVSRGSIRMHAKTRVAIKNWVENRVRHGSKIAFVMPDFLEVRLDSQGF